MNYAPIDKIYQILIAVPLTGLWVLDIAALLPLDISANNGRVGIIPWQIFSTQTALAQSSTQPIVPEPHSTNTVVTPVTPSNNSDQTRFDVTGGKRSKDNNNLFHSLTRFNLGENQIVNFISNPDIKNILTRVTGGDVSVINGLIQVTGGNSNLFIINSAGFIFGANARLDVPGSFVVTTGSSIGFDDGWFNATGENNYDILTGNPSSFSFPTTNSGVIINAGELTVEPGESVTLLGGTIINTGKISAPGGEITISTVPGENLVRISQEGRLLSLEIETEGGENSSTNSTEELPTLNALSIPELLTGNSEVMEVATGVIVNDDNQVVLTGYNQVIPTDSGTTIVSGSLDISSAENSELLNTSRINIFGEKVGLFDAKLNASGIHGSGDIRIGGDFSGLGTVPNASRTYVDEKTQISATSFLGEGGNVVISSVEETRFFGKIEAIGYIGEESVSGEENSTQNIVEISSQGTLIFDGTVNLGSPNSLGNLLLKAENLNIVDGNIAQEDNSLTAETATESEIPESSRENNSLTAETATESEIPESSRENNSLTAETATESEIPESSIDDNPLTGEIPTESEIPESSIDDNPLTAETATESEISESSIDDNPLTGEIATESEISESSIDDNSLTAEIATESEIPESSRENNPLTAEIATESEIPESSIENNPLTGERAIESEIPESSIENNPLTGEIAIESQITKSSIENISNANIRIEASDNITINNLSEAELNLANTRGKISFIADSDQNNLGSFTIDSENTINTQGAAISISGTTINTGSINTKGGELNLSSSQGFVMTNNLSTANSNTTVESNGGDINIDAQGDIITGEINSSGESRGGNINLNSQTGRIEITTLGIDATSTNGRGGNVRINAATDIDTENINAEGEESGGNIDITSENTLNLRGISTSSNSTETGNISLTGNEINLLGGEDSISSNGKLTLHSASENQNITLGGFENTEAVNLTTSDLATLANGFASITIGKSENSGTITIYSPENSDDNGVTFHDPVTIQAEIITGTGTITGIDDAKITLNANRDILIGDISAPEGISITSIQGDVKIGDVTTNTSENSIRNIDIVTGGAIETGRLTTTGTTGGNINIQAGDRLTTGRINSSAISGSAGEIQLSAENQIEVTSIQAEGGNLGGNINIQAGDLTTGEINSSATSGSAGEIQLSAENQIEVTSIQTEGTTGGGNIKIQAGDRLTTGRINSSATSGSAGEIQLSAENQIEVTSIQAEAGNIGGNVEISTGDTLRITGTFFNQNQNIASISTAGELAGGNISISTGKTPFTVGDATTNGSVGAITDGKFTISSDRSLPNRFDLKELENSQSQNQESGTITETESQNQQSQPQPDSTESSNSNEDNQTTAMTPTKSSNSNEDNQTTAMTQSELDELSENPELVETSDNIEVETTQIPIEENNEPSLNTNQEVKIVSQDPEPNSQILDSSEPITSVTENVDNLQASINSEAQISPPELVVVENQNQTQVELQQPDNSQLVLENSEQTNFLENTNPTLTPAVSNILENTNPTLTAPVSNILENTDPTLTQPVPNILENTDPTLTEPVSNILENTDPTLTEPVSNQTVAIENPAQGKSSQKPTPTIIVEENITTTASEISSKNNFHQISLTDTVSQIELTRDREFASYLGKNISKRTATAANIRNTLSSVAKIGIRPAIIYVSAQPNYLELQLFLPNGKPVVKSIQKSRDEVIEVAKKFTNQIRTPSQLDSHDYLSNAQKLYQWLIAPIAEELVANNINMTVFSMDSGLRTIPIAALHDGQQFLVEKYSLGLIPSFSLTDTRYVGLDGSQVLAMGASEFPASANQIPLPAVPVELKTIVNNIWPGKSFLNQGFTLENLKQQRSKEKFRIIHLATHGEFHPGSADNSYIQFWDTKLRLNELRQLRLYSPQVELLVLSACTTAVGDEDAELGFAGLAVQAGVKSALASLWYVSDTGTLALMTEFYQHLSKRPIKAEALREAQLAMLRGDVHLQNRHIFRNGNQHLSLPLELARGGKRDLSHPYYWAAFTMIGSPW